MAAMIKTALFRVIVLPLLGLLFPSLLQAQTAPLSQTAVGRFGAGHTITSNTASQDLLVWNVNNTGRQAEVRLYDDTGTPVSLGLCGLPISGSGTIGNEVRDIAWTQLTCRYTSGNATVDVLESLLTPVLFFRTNSTALGLFQPDNALPAIKQPQIEGVFLPLSDGLRRMPTGGYSASRDGKLTRPHFVVAVKQGRYHAIVICLLNHNPATISATPARGLQVTWLTENASPHYVGLFPLNGGIPVPEEGSEAGNYANLYVGLMPLIRDIPLPNTTDNGPPLLPVKIIKRIDWLATLFLRVPTGLTETYSLTEKTVRITNTVGFAPFIDDWGWSSRYKGCVLLPSALSNARRYGYPVTIDHPLIDPGYPLFLSSLDLIKDTDHFTFELPLPDLYETLNTPFYDPHLDSLLPPVVRQTVRDYSAYVQRTYAKKSDFMYEGSAIGEGRILASEYSGYRMMNAEARQAFDRYADRAARQKLYNWKNCYGYGVEAANGRRFLLDNYRIGGQDYIDAGWFGYSITAMWARAHYGSHWKEVQQYWPRIRELFYGWNWVYSDYSAMYAPLYVDGTHGGNPKGYTDNMGMLPALYAWGRMADHLGDKQTLQDALYMLARDRVARFGRMVVYAYANSIGYKTDVTYLVSDMGNGPNIAPSSKFIPPNPSQWNTGDIVDYGDWTAGLWFLSGSFLEPVTAETIELMATGDMRYRVWESVFGRFDFRFPRWWANPAAGEMANYQIYLRGLLFHTDPALLRLYFDYQDGFLDGRWLAEPWHYDAFAGIVLSPFYGRDHRNEITVECRNGQKGTFAKNRIEWNLLQGIDGRAYLTLWNATASSLPIRLHINLPTTGKSHALVNVKTGTKTRLSHSKASLVLMPCANLFALSEQPFFLSAQYKRTFPFSASPALPSLPSASIRFELEAARIARLPDIGKVTVYARNRKAFPVTLHLSGHLNDKRQLEKSFTLGPNNSATWTVPLRVTDLPSGKYNLTVRVAGDGVNAPEQTRHVVLLAQPQPDSPPAYLTLYDFEQDTDGWTMPDWPDGNRDEHGNPYHPTRSSEAVQEGRDALRIPIRLSAGQISKSFVGVRPNADWNVFRRVRVYLYLPPSAPEGLQAGFYMMGNEWKWREAKSTTPLIPGKWAMLEIPLYGEKASVLWNFDPAELNKALQNVIDFGVRIDNTGSTKPGYQGPVYLDNFQVEAE